jgi:Icc-related predicted phosphoesterase
MKALIFSDIHGDIKTLNRLLDIEADLYIAAGDLGNWGRGLDKAGEALQRRGSSVWVLPGNHESETQVAAMCEKYGLHNFHGRTFEVDGLHFAGLGYSNPTPFDTPGEYSEEELARRLEPFAGLQPLVLVCHCPPKGTLLDRAGANRHFGSTSVLEFLQRRQPAWFFCGHIHEAEGVRDRIGATSAANAGKRGCLLDLAKMSLSPEL